MNNFILNNGFNYLKLYNEDCIETIERIDEIDLIITSPPYFNAKEYSQYESLNDYMLLMNNIFSKLFMKLKENKFCIINISPILIPRKCRNDVSRRIPLPFYFVPMMEKIGYEFMDDIIWQKPNGSVKNRNGSFFKHRKPCSYKPNVVTEYVLVFKKPSKIMLEKTLKNHSLVNDDYEKTNVWLINPETNSWHPAPFPKKLVDNLIKYYSYENDLIYDPFSGSGTTGIVSLKNKRNVILSEINNIFYNNTINDINK